MDELFVRLRTWEREGCLPFHMPGHKRNSTRFPALAALGAGLDLTEIPGFDDLHEPEEILLDAQARCAALYGSRAAFFCVNGSTGGILAGIRAATRRGDRVLMARNCHKAVYHAVELCGLVPVFLQPPLLADFGCASSLPPAQIEAALRAQPDIRLVILSSPSYEGVLCDLASICAHAHAREIPVFVDEAHGAHLGFSDFFPQSACQLGADLVVQSFHKTLPSLTQTAVLHCNSTRISRDEVARQLGIFQTSSPSYLFLASLALCVTLLETQRTSLFSDWSTRLLRFHAKLTPLQHLQLLKPRADLFALDPSKLLIGTAGSGLSGAALALRLRERHHIQVEMAQAHYALAMTGAGDTNEQLDALADALLAIDADCKPCPLPDFPPSLPLPNACLGLEEALAAPFLYRSPEESEHCVSAASIWLYPPGIPLILPGERFSKALLSQITQAQALGLRVITTRGDVSQGLAVLSDFLPD